MPLKKILALVTICCTSFLTAQIEITIEAFILDSKTSEPIPYVNIGFVDKSIGTVTNEKGQFSLVYNEDEITLKDALAISALGYETTIVNPRQLIRLLTNTNKIYLKPQPEALDEVFITNDKRKEIRLGHANADTHAMGYWKDKNALGGEIAKKIKIKHKQSLLLDLKFNIVENNTDSLKIRVNIYDYKRGYPSTKILKQNILTTIKQKEGEFKVDLKPYNVKVDDDIVVGIELVKVYGEQIEFAISAQPNRGPSYLRLVSQDNWVKHSQTGMNFSVLTSIAEKQNNQVSDNRDKPNKLTLYWDSSLSMKNRNLNEELALLEKYLKALKKVNVEVIKFNNKVFAPKEFEVVRGKNESLFDYLKDTFYDGESDFNEVLKKNPYNADAILLFTDGNTSLSPLETRVNIPVFTINSLSTGNHLKLQRVAFYTDGHYLNLANLSSNLALDFILNDVQDLMDYSPKSFDEAYLFGKVFYVAGPIQGANIRLKNSFIEAQSDSEGFFKIKAKVKDVLVISYLGMIEREFRILDPNTIAILLKPDGELLDEVIVEGESKKGKEIETGFGKKNEDALGYSVKTLSSDEIGPQYNTLADLLVGRFAGVEVVGLNVGYSTPKFKIRGGGGSMAVAYAMIDIDGLVYDSGQEIPPIDIQNIDDITILKSVAATNRYGFIGRGGAIVIRMKTLSAADAISFESALITGNDYTEQGVLFLEASNDNIPNYLLELNTANSFEEALTTYKSQTSTESLISIPYYFDVSDYFMRWNQDFAYSVLTNIASVANENPKALKALAFKMEELGKLKDAKFIYERLVKLRPKHEQPYRDLALIYTANKEYTKAMDVYKQILSNSIEDVEFLGLGQTIENELMHLLAFNRSKVDYLDLPVKLRTAKFKYDLRIVFEWNDSNTEFELQFVNPQKKFFKWSHTKFENRERLIDEITYGYNTEEFIIDDADSGEWIINIERISDEPLVNPTYLKYTVFKNYGLTNETKEVKVIKLYKQNQKVTIDKFLHQ